MQSISSVDVQLRLHKNTLSCNSKDANKLPQRDLEFSKLQQSYKNQRNSYYNDAIVGNTFGKDFSLQSNRYKTRSKTIGIKGKSLIEFDPLLKKNKSYEDNDGVTTTKTKNDKSYDCYNSDYNSELHLLFPSQASVHYQSKLPDNNNYCNSNVEEQQKQQPHTVKNNKIDNNKKKNHQQHRRNKSSSLPITSYESLRNNNNSTDKTAQNSSNHKKTKSVPLYLSFGDYSIFKKKKVSNVHNEILADKTNNNSSTSAALLSSLSAKPSPTSFLTGKEKIVTMMNAMGPSVFKLEMPALEEFMFDIRLCQFMEDYRKKSIPEIDLHDTLAGVPRLHLQTIISIGKLPYSSSYDQRLIDDAYKPMIKSLLKCANDVQLSYHTTEEKEQHQQPTMNSCSSRSNSISNSNSSDSNSSSDSSSSSSSSKSSSPIGDHAGASNCSEVAIFQCQRQFVVVFKGTSSQQQKGGVAALFSNTNSYKKSKSTLVPLSIDTSPSASPSDDPQIYSCFRDTYMRMENRIIQRLDNLIDENPFCDVVFTGHSFGGALAQIAAVRYATARSVIRVSCHVFGSPKVGNIGFANLANYSLPNLKVVRVEYKNDYTCQVPTSTMAGTNTPHGGEGYHIGHLVAIDKSIHSSGSSSKKSNNKENQKVSCKEDTKRNKEPSIVFAYKFNKGNNNNNNTRKSFTTFVSSRKKKNRGIEEYVTVLEGIETNAISWPKDYEGENIGEGVRGNNNESRTLA